MPSQQEGITSVSLGLCIVLREIAEETTYASLTETLDSINFSAEGLTDSNLVEMLEAFYPGITDLALEKLIRRELLAARRERSTSRRQKVRDFGGTILKSFASLSTFGIPPYRRKG